MSAKWAKNEATAAKRRAWLVVRKNDGTLAPSGTDFTGMVFVCGVNAPDLDLATGTLTNMRRPLVVADDTFTADNTTEQLTATDHGLKTGDGPVQISSTTTLPAGLSAATDYWIIRVDADTFKLAASLADAYAGTEVTFTDDGTGTHTISDTASTERGLDGMFIFEATQAETNHDGPETIILVDGGIGSDYDLFTYQAGGMTTVMMESSAASVWSESSGSHDLGATMGDLLRGTARQALAPREKVGTTETTKSLDGSIDSHSGTVTGTTRTVTIHDLT